MTATVRRLQTPPPRPMDRLLTRAEAADLLRVPPKTLAAWAYRGDGPPFYKVGRHAMYRPDDVAAWLETRRVGGAAMGGNGGRRDDGP